MCGRFALAATPAEMREVFDAFDTPDFPPRYNIAPTQPIETVRNDHCKRRIVPVRWGLVPGWAKDPADFSLLINARAETAAQKPAFRAAMRRRRCLVPASGFYEWQRRDGGKLPYWIAPKDGGIVAFAGLWESWSDADGGDIESGAILTTDANAALADIHHRMPAVIAPADFDLWLAGEAVKVDEAAALLRPAAADYFVAVPVSPRVNAVRNDDADLMRPVDDTEEQPRARKRKPKSNDPPDGQLSLL